MANLELELGDTVIIGKVSLVVDSLKHQLIVISCGSKTIAIKKGEFLQTGTTSLKLTKVKRDSAILRVKHNKGGTQTVEHIRKKCG